MSQDMMWGEPGAIVYSDDESDSRGERAMEDDRDNWENFTIRFGKYKGTTLSTMITQGRTRQYLRYILKWPDIRPNTAANINKALAHYEQAKAARNDPPPMTPPKLTREYSRAN